MAQPSFVAESHYGWWGASQVFTVPTVQDGDVGMLICYGSTNSDGSWSLTGAPTPTAQWYDSSNFRSLKVWQLPLTASLSGTTFTVNSVNSGHCGALVVYRNVSSVTNYRLSEYAGGSTVSSFEIPGILINDLKVLLFAGCNFKDNSTFAGMETTDGTERSRATESSSVYRYEVDVHSLDGFQGAPYVTFTTTSSQSTVDTEFGVFILTGSGTPSAFSGHIYKGRASASDDTTGAV